MNEASVPAVRLEDITKTFSVRRGSVVALEDIDLTI